MNTTQKAVSPSPRQHVRGRIARFAIMGAATAVAITAALAIQPAPLCAAAVGTSGSTDPRSAAGTPNLPAGFTGTFADRSVDVGGGVHLHAIVGGHGRPLLLIHRKPRATPFDLLPLSMKVRPLNMLTSWTFRGASAFGPPLGNPFVIGHGGDPTND